MIDSKLKPWLLEVNHAPSFDTETPLDHFINFHMIKDSLKILNLSYQNKIRIISNKR